MDTFWEGFWTLPIWYIMLWLGSLQFGFLFIVWELAHRKMKISRDGLELDRLSTRRGLLYQWLHRKPKNEKISIQDLNR